MAFSHKEYRQRTEVQEKRRLRSNKWAKDNRNKANVYQFKYAKQDFFQYSLLRKRAQCKANDWEFNLTKEHLLSIRTLNCPILGTPLIYEYGSRKVLGENKATLDRRDPMVGYVIGNVAWISFAANTMKGNNTPKTLKAILHYLSDTVRAPDATLLPLPQVLPNLQHMPLQQDQQVMCQSGLKFPIRIPLPEQAQDKLQQVHPLTLEQCELLDWWHNQ